MPVLDEDEMIVNTYSVRKLTRSAKGVRPSKLSPNIHGCKHSQFSIMLSTCNCYRKYSLSITLHITYQIINLKTLMIADPIN